MKRPKKAAPKTPAPTTMIQNCTFTSHPASDSESVLTIARALEANATALNALANQIIRQGPLLQIGGDLKD